MGGDHGYDRLRREAAGGNLGVDLLAAPTLPARLFHRGRGPSDGRRNPLRCATRRALLCHFIVDAAPAYDSV